MASTISIEVNLGVSIVLSALSFRLGSLLLRNSKAYLAANAISLEFIASNIFDLAKINGKFWKYSILSRNLLSELNFL